MNREALIQWIEQHTDELISDFQTLLRAESVKGEPSEKAPFGKGVREALDVVIRIGERDGFRVKDFDGYAAHLEIGDGQEMVASLSHVDVVPPGNYWSSPPFSAEIRDGYVYARGACDDKGATVASMYAARALKELGVPLKRRVRIIVGCDEESGWECMDYYLKHEPERPVCGVSPDGGFPLIYGEKGIANLYLEKELDDTPGVIVRAHGGERHNMVPDLAEAVLNLSQKPAIEGEDLTIEATGEGWRVAAKGKSAHGSTPQEGMNAVARLLRAIQPLNLPDNELWLNDVLRWAESLDGAALGIAHQDEVSGALTCNLGIFDHNGKRVLCVFNIRYPVTWTLDGLKQSLQPELGGTGFRLTHVRHTAPLYVPLETPFVQAIIRAYREETGDMTEPQTMGGGTYARVMPNLVAIGAGFEGDGRAHEPDERMSIESLKKMCRVYARVFEALANL